MGVEEGGRDEGWEWRRKGGMRGESGGGRGEGWEWGREG